MFFRVDRPTGRSKACEKRRFLFIANAKSHRLKPRFSSGSVFDHSHMRWSVISQTQQSWWFSLILSLKMSCCFEFHWLSSDLQVLKWLDFLSFIEIPAILHRSKPWHFIYFIRDTQNQRIFGWHPIFHMGEVKNWPGRNQWNGGVLESLFENFCWLLFLLICFEHWQHFVEYW